MTHGVHQELHGIDGGSCVAANGEGGDQHFEISAAERKASSRFPSAGAPSFRTVRSTGALPRPRKFQSDTLQSNSRLLIFLRQISPQRAHINKLLCYISGFNLHLDAGFVIIDIQCRMSKANASHWIAQISYFSRQGLHKETLHVFHRLLTEGLRPDRYVLPSVLRACGNLSDLKSGRAVHNLVTRSLLDSDAFIDSALIDMYSKCGELHSARRVFDGTAEKDLVTWNSMVSGYAHGGLAEIAMVLLIKMRCLGVKQDLVTWNALISGFSRMGNDAMAMDLFRSMQVDGVEPDVVSWTSIISGFVLNFKYGKALGMFRQMVVVAGMRPSSVTISSLLPACANVADLRHGKEIHGYAVLTGADKDLFVGSALVDMYAKCGLISEAVRIFDKMQKRSTVSWNSMIFGYSNHGYCENAIRLFYQMQNEHVKPDHLTFTAVFTACSHAGMVRLGKLLFILMQDYHGIEPRLEHYACMVDLLGKAGKLAEAYHLIKGMPMEPDSFVWGALLGACQRHGNVQLAKTAILHLFEIEPESAGSCVILSSMLLDSGRQEDAVKMKKLMKKQKMKKFLGCSWMEST